MKQDLFSTFEKVGQSLAGSFVVRQIEIEDAPIFLAAAWPIAPGVTGHKPRLPSGRGTTLAQAMLGAAAEALELRASLAQSHLETAKTLPARQGRAVVAMRDLLSGAEVLVAAQEVFLDFAVTNAEPLFADARSTGCASHPDLQVATRMALFECVERDAVALWWHGGLSPKEISAELIDTRQPRLFWWLQGRSRQTRLFALTTDTGLPVALAVSSAPDGRKVAIGTAARYDIAEAALAAVTEMIQTESSLDAALDADDPEALRWLENGSMLSQPQFLPAVDAVRDVSQPSDDMALLDRLDRIGLRALAKELTLQGDPIPTVRVVVPGLSDMGSRLDRDRLDRLCSGSLPRRVPAAPDPEPF